MSDLLKDFSILICSLESRSLKLNRLLSILKEQADDRVEILVSVDSGEKSVGAKRNELVKASCGKYLAFIDDDDIVSDDYVDLILKAIQDGPDVVGLQLDYYQDGVFYGVAYHSIEYRSWYQEPNHENGTNNYYRNPNHLNPVKREFASSILYPEIDIGEDRDYSMRLLSLLNSEHYIKKPIYTYLCETK